MSGEEGSELEQYISEVVSKKAADQIDQTATMKFLAESYPVLTIFKTQAQTKDGQVIYISKPGKEELDSANVLINNAIMHSSVLDKKDKEIMESDMDLWLAKYKAKHPSADRLELQALRINWGCVPRDNMGGHRASMLTERRFVAHVEGEKKKRGFFR